MRFTVRNSRIATDFCFLILKLFLRTAVSRFAIAGSFALLLYWAALHVSSESSASLAWPLRETLLSRSGLPSSGKSTSRTAPLDSLWRGPEKETARVPPSLDSPLSAAPETFLLRDAVSAFPIAFGPLPQPLPGARCPVWVALVRSPWRSFWNRVLPLPDRACRLSLPPTNYSKFRLSSIRIRPPPACPADPPREMKIPA